MRFLENECLLRLRKVLIELRRRGGLMSPAVYDTAQVLRLAPWTVHSPDALDWLTGQQHPDGGWGAPAAPRARDLPTLAAALALRERGEFKRGRDAAEAGFAFLRSHSPQHWNGLLTDDLPVAVELLLPRLLDEAIAQGIDLSIAPYALLRALGERKRRTIAAMQPRGGAAPTHSWEGWGTWSDPTMIDGSGGVGHSPAATAAWLAMAANIDGLDDACRGAIRFLKAASASCEGASGASPVAWPIDRFEQIWVLHALSVAGLLDHPYLRDEARAQILDLRRAMRSEGIGFSDHFIADGDCTATAIATLITAGYQAESDVIYRFKMEHSFITYPIEIQPSLTTTAHAVLALALTGDDVRDSSRYLESKQSPDGRWIGDKWHCSWLYTTAQVLTALAFTDRIGAISAAVAALRRHQREDGGWGFADRATPAETAYVVLAFHTLRTRGLCSDQVGPPLVRAAAWLAHNFETSSLRKDQLWIEKELYCPYRIDQAFVLSALLAVEGSASLGAPKRNG